MAHGVNNTTPPEGQLKVSNDTKWVIEDKIYMEICRGVQQRNIVKNFMEDKYGLGLTGLTEKSIKRHYEKVRDRIKKEYEEKIEVYRQELAAALSNILTECRDSKDRTNAIRAVESLAKLTGAYAPEKHEVKQDVVIDFGFDVSK